MATKPEQATDQRPDRLRAGTGLSLSSVTVLAAGFGAMLLLMVLILAADLRSSYVETVKRHEAQALNATRALLQFSDGAFRQALRALRSVGVDPASSHIVLPPGIDTLADSLRRTNLASFGYQGIGVVNADGDLYMTSGGMVTPPASVRDRPYFQFHKENREPQFSISEPNLGRASGTWLIPVNYRLETPDGAFAGVISALVLPEYFENFMGTLGVDSATIFSSDGKVIARIPKGPQFIGQNIRRDGMLMSTVGSVPEGTFHAASSLDRIERIYGYKASESHPIFVTAAFDVDNALAEWRGELIRTIALIAVLAAVCLAVGLFAVGLVRRDAASTATARAARLEAENARKIAERADNAKSAFLAHMSHELRTPLNAILGFSEMIHGGLAGHTGARTQEYAGHITDSGQHLLGLIDDLLYLAPLDRSKETLVRDRIDIPATMDLAIERLGHEISRRQIRIVTNGAADDPVWLNRRALFQIFFNLLSNAIRHSPNGDRVVITFERTQAALQVTVAGNGSGMPSDLAARIGEPFLQDIDPTTANHMGAGIGLAVAKSLVERQDGTLTFKTGTGEGTCTIVRFLLHANP
ncbi:MAG: hypothetical protein HY059_10605 [Proteobacteria bacterium]|nr:hypothetical protein [Pseudomonadota bacterium]